MEGSPGEEPHIQRDIPPEEILAIPDEVNRESIEFVLVEVLGRIAQDYELEAALAPPIEMDRPESLEDFMHAVELRIENSGREVAEKTGALNLLHEIINQLKIILKAINNS
jgi:hypothetical protein